MLLEAEVPGVFGDGGGNVAVCECTVAFPLRWDARESAPPLKGSPSRRKLFSLSPAGRASALVLPKEEQRLLVLGRRMSFMKVAFQVQGC